ncbi:MAG: S-adenosylmethionine:tRNA ribosyltransferase-isomerase, partial [Desulfocucumaceae bacterium]
MKTSDFDYYLPEDLIAQDPAPIRDQSRLMVVDREKDTIDHKSFKDIVGYLRSGDVLVLNDTRVIPARLMGLKEGAAGQGKVEVFLLREREEKLWEVLVRPGRRIRPGVVVNFEDGLLRGTVLESTDAGGRLIRFESLIPFAEALGKIGKMPLPPYIKK